MPSQTLLRGKITRPVPTDPREFAIEVALYSEGRVLTYQGIAQTVQLTDEPASHLDELLAAEMREVFQRDYRRRQEAEADVQRRVDER